MDFVFKHPKSGEVKTVYVSDEMIHHELGEYAYERLECDCQPVGETNVIECGCDDYLCEFELQPLKKAEK